MNAYGLADELEECREYELPEFVHKTANMLRQQANRIAELQKQYDAMVMSFESRLATRGYEIQIKDQQDRIAELEKEKKHLTAYVDYFGDEITTPQTKPLSDEEIEIIYSKMFGYKPIDNSAVYFARAIEAKVRG